MDDKMLGKMDSLIDENDYPVEQRELVREFNDRLTKIYENSIASQEHMNQELTEAKGILGMGVQVIEGLTKEYSSIWLVDRSDKSFQLFSSSEANMVQDIVKRILEFDNYENAISFYIQNYVCEKDRIRVKQESSVRNIWRQLAEKDFYTINYQRYKEKHVLEYQQMIFAKSNSKNNNSKFILTFKNIDDDIQRDYANIAKEERLAQYEEDRKMMALIHQSLSSGYWSMEFNKKCELQSCVWSDEFREMLGYESMEDFPDEIESWSDLIYGDDKKRVMNAFWDAVRDYKGKSIFDVEYRLYTRKQGLRWFHTAGRISRRKDGSPAHFVGLFRDIHEDHMHMEKMQEQLAIVEALSKDYLNVFKVNVKERSAEIIKLDGYVTKGLEKDAKQKYPYDALCRQYVADRVYPYDADSLLHAMDLDVVVQELSTHDEYVSSYRAMIQGEIHYYQFKYIMLSGVGAENKIIAGFKNIDALVHAAKEREFLIEKSETDMMTSLFNRGSGENKVTEKLDEGIGGMFCILDIDKFKSINDTYGHNVGDKVIRSVAKCFKNTFRDRDITFRLGGDEFAVFAVGVHDEKIGREILQRFIKSINAIEIEELAEYKVTVSIGAVMIARNQRCSFEQAYMQADNCLYESKREAEHTIVFAN